MARMHLGSNHPAPGELRRGWTFFHKAPGYNPEGLLQLAVHLPVYLVFSIQALVYFLPRDLWRRFVKQEDFTDTHIWDLATETLLMMLCTIETGPTGKTLLVYQGVPASKVIFRPSTQRPAWTLLDGSTLRITMRDGVLESARTNAGEVVSHGRLSRNEILVDTLIRTLGIWVHTSTHLRCEDLAGEICQKKLATLKPSSMFTHALHEGLLHARLSPAGNVPLFRSSLPPIPDWLSLACREMPPHAFHRIKTKRLRFYNFYSKAHAVVVELCREFDLDVNINNLFAATVLHSVDHRALYRVSNTMPARSSTDTRSGFFLSLAENNFFNHVWTRPTWNPLYSELVKDSKQPFYAELYRRLVPLDRELADEVFLSCSF
jgi:hypothetical protein